VIAFADESVRRGPSGLAYVVAAAVIVPGDAEEARQVLRALSGRTVRFHWRTERDSRRIAMLGHLSELGVSAFARWHSPTTGRRQERSRALCLAALAGDLTRAGIDELVLEAREEHLNRRDLVTLVGAKAAGVIPEGFRYRFAGSTEEPLLWAADALAGVVGGWVVGEADTYLAHLRPADMHIQRVEG